MNLEKLSRFKTVKEALEKIKKETIITIAKDREE